MDRVTLVTSILNLIVGGFLNVYLWWYIPRKFKRMNARNAQILRELEAKGAGKNDANS